jgi:hypothetical protein
MVANLKRSPVVSEINTALEWFLPLHSSKYRPGTDCTSSPSDSERTDERHSSISLPSSDPASGKKALRFEMIEMSACGTKRTV